MSVEETKDFVNKCLKILEDPNELIMVGGKNREYLKALCEYYQTWEEFDNLEVVTKSLKSEHQLSVEDFMRRAGQEVPPQPTIPNLKTRKLRAKLVIEECLELINLGLGLEIYLDGLSLGKWKDDLFFEEIGEPDLVQLADGCADIAVVTTGTLSACGIADQDIQEAINESNLAKFEKDKVCPETGRTMKGGYKSDGTDGNPEGKWVKPEWWEAPDLESIIMSQIVEVDADPSIDKETCRLMIEKAKSRTGPSIFVLDEDLQEEAIEAYRDENFYTSEELLEEIKEKTSQLLNIPEELLEDTQTRIQRDIENSEIELQGVTHRGHTKQGSSFANSNTRIHQEEAREGNRHTVPIFDASRKEPEGFNKSDTYLCTNCRLRVNDNRVRQALLGEPAGQCPECGERVTKDTIRKLDK